MIKNADVDDGNVVKGLVVLVRLGVFDQLHYVHALDTPVAAIAPQQLSTPLLFRVCSVTPLRLIATHLPLPLPSSSSFLFLSRPPLAYNLCVRLRLSYS